MTERIMSLRGRYAPEAISSMTQGGLLRLLRRLAMTGGDNVIARSAFCDEAISP